MVHHSIVFSILLMSVAFVVMMSSMVSATCVKPSDCSPDECCLRPMATRYGSPSCQPLRKEGDACRVSNSPYNGSIDISPNGDKLDVQELYTVICPCNPSNGLSCFRGICQKSTEVNITTAV